MNYKLLKDRMDKFFVTITAEELMSSFENFGYEFRDMTEEEITEQKRNNYPGYSNT